MRVIAGLLLVALASQARSAEVGIASVFADRIVACPPYRINPYKVFGAAHKTLPCGTLVEVTNKLNGRSVVVPIVDKGPCTTAHCNSTMPRRVRSRIFDMLPLVARKLGSTGLTPVRLIVQ